MSAGHEKAIADVASILAEAGIADAEAEASAIVDAARRDAGEAGFEQRARELAATRAGGTPLAYVTGRTMFMGVELSIAPGALIPREETELLGRTAVAILNALSTGSAPRVIDMCCGAGNLLSAIAVHVPSARVWGSDLTDGTVALARTNVNRLDLANRVTVAQGDLFGSLEGLGLEGTVDMVVCNPPYISTGKLEKEKADLLAAEPREAFDGGPYGVSIFQRLLRDARKFLKPDGHLLFEIGAGQDRQVAAMISRTGGYHDVQLKTDASGLPRVIVCRSNVGGGSPPL